MMELLAVPSCTYHEQKLIEYISGILDSKGYNYTIDNIGNIYITKGEAEAYPLVLAHTDTVHAMEEMYIAEESLPDYNGEYKDALKAYTVDGDYPTGIGGDDKAGIFICLQLLEQCDVLKVFLPVSEELGCIGTDASDPEFFEDVLYAIAFDSTEGNTCSRTLMGTELFTEGEYFINTSDVILQEHGFTEWHEHPYTDVMILRERHGFECLNLAAGYYDYHTVNEYVVIDDVENAIVAGKKIIDSLNTSRLIEFANEGLLC